MSRAYISELHVLDRITINLLSDSALRARQADDSQWIAQRELTKGTNQQACHVHVLWQRTTKNAYYNYENNCAWSIFSHCYDIVLDQQRWIKKCRHWLSLQLKFIKCAGWLHSCFAATRHVCESRTSRATEDLVFGAYVCVLVGSRRESRYCTNW